MNRLMYTANNKYVRVQLAEPHCTTIIFELVEQSDTFTGSNYRFKCITL